MVWLIKLERGIKYDLKKIDEYQKERIRYFIYEKLPHIIDPRSIGEALKGKELGKFWKYRVGNYRIIAQIKDKELSILVISIGHRKEIYKS